MGISHVVKVLSIVCITMVISGCSQKKEVRIAACPTFWDVIYKMDLLGRETQSTSESFHLLNRGYVDYVLAGRTPKPGEQYGDYKILGSGYSFLSKESQTISDEELKSMKFYTDLPDSEIIKTKFGIQNIEQVADVYKYIDTSIIITSWEQTDYSKGDTVHVLHTSGERYIESRIPIVYCREKCEESLVKIIKDLLNN